MNPAQAAAATLTPRQGLAYGLLGLPLAFVALPLYVLLPNHYANAFGMPLATLGAVLLGAGDIWPFVAVCALSGAALGADLALPGALLAGVVAAQGDSGRHEGAYFGWWNFATKLNLALAAGLALPLLGALGYSPGTRDAHALGTLSLAYAVLPCALKLLAAGALAFFFVRRSPRAPVPT